MLNEKIAIVGTGMMGMSLAALFTGNGYDTTVLATKETSARRGECAYQEMYGALLQRGLVTAQQAAGCRERLHFALSYQELCGCTLFFECAVEDLAIKQQIYRDIERTCPACKAIASTSSALSPDDLCKSVACCASKIVVTHPFNPPHLVPFVELVKSPCSCEEATQLVYDFLEDCGRKVCIMKKSAPGFIANRLQHALLREAIYMVEQGMADPREIDKALMYSFMPRYTCVGLFEHQDAAGLDMVKGIEDYLFPDLCDRKTAFDYVNERVAAGRLGQKTGQGTYAWDAASIASFKKRAAEPYWKYFNWHLPDATV
jgi:3-hydroxybutyryl-CoA dehydrogenase